jgi:hypothetical protein
MTSKPALTVTCQAGFVLAHLAQCFDEWHGLNVTDSATELYHTDIGRAISVVDWDAGNALDPVLDCICDVRYDLHCLAQVVPPSLPLNHRLHKYDQPIMKSKEQWPHAMTQHTAVPGISSPL